MKFKEVYFSELKATMARYWHTQSKLEELIGVSQNYIFNRLTNRIDWTYSDMEKICELYEKPMDELFKNKH